MIYTFFDWLIEQSALAPHWAKSQDFLTTSLTDVVKGGKRAILSPNCNVNELDEHMKQYCWNNILRHYWMSCCNTTMLRDKLIKTRFPKVDDKSYSVLSFVLTAEGHTIADGIKAYLLPCSRCCGARPNSLKHMAQASEKLLDSMLADPEYKPTLLKASCIALDHIHPGVARKVIDLNWQKSSKPIIETIPDSSTVSISKTKVK
eukprot:CAMPEP_0168594966 /NCGR_PEP_ID=MMETSP0420-20121227/9185_1 /TAXON_ID=498008 /ORGANISM="Pessonella sp." /LENGTH=203 /DNA_ID=CAMNT_0008631331 /DNA_START=454 /DNA_END=1062 /DNA_ORIENTATION=-